MIRFLITAGVFAAIACAIIRWVFPRSPRAYAGDVRELWSAAHRAWSDESLAHRLALAIIVASAFAFRLANITHPMRYDEAFTWVRFASEPLRAALSDYSEPNNHLFHTLLVWISGRLFGEAGWAIRLPAFLAGLAIVPATYVVARRLGDATSALFAAAVAAALPSLVFYSINARGYTLICLLFLIQILLVRALADENSARLWIPFSLATAIGLYTAPVMIYPAGTAILWLVIERWRRGRQALLSTTPYLAAALALAGVITAMLYTPVVLRSGLGPLVANPYVTPLNWWEFATELRAFGGVAYESLGLGVPVAVGIAIAAAVLVGLLRNDDGRRTERLTLALSIVACAAILIVAKRRVPPARVLLYVMPLVGVYAGIGCAWLLTLGIRSFRVRHLVMAAATVLLTIGAGISELRRGVVLGSQETNLLGLRNAPEMAEYLLDELRPKDYIVLKAVGPTLDYYMRTIGGRRLDEFTVVPRPARLLVIVDIGHRQTLDYVRLKRPAIPWDQYTSPTLLRQFNTSQVYESRPKDQPVLLAGEAAANSP